ncbi:methionine sulfoxide reductase B2 [Columba livia]|uniref:Methionine sulfoxide reductase B2 n=1 Tax=Columba livia TaxID=8932 RepID=A0A2I0MRC1_COLLI|nr:methionine sulfoxide reductase B2 [Columba livia]
MDPQTTAGPARGFSQAEPSPHARLGGARRAQVRARCPNPFCSQPAASAGAARPGCRMPVSPLAGAVRPSGGSAGAGQAQRHRCRERGCFPLPSSGEGLREDT